jgi:hypothetical protein
MPCVLQASVGSALEASIVPGLRGVQWVMTDTYKLRKGQM